jgi:hypothetical protein
MATLFHAHENVTEVKMNAPERELIIRPIAGTKTLDSAGVVDTRLWKGGNSIRAIMGEGGIWYFKYENGILPEALKGKYTSISKLVTFAKEYFSKRNLEIVEVKNIHNGS